MKICFCKFVAIALVALSAASAMAKPVKNGPTIYAADTDDVTLGGKSSTALAFSGSNPGSGDTSGFKTPFESYGPGGWVELKKFPLSGSDTFPQTPLVFTFSQASQQDDTSGSWSVKNTAATDLDVDLVFAMHASDASTAFLFDDQIIKAGTTLTGTWAIEWHNNGGQIPGFSNLEFFDRAGTVAPPPPPVERSVPEPASLALIGSGLLGLSFVSRRRKK